MSKYRQRELRAIKGNRAANAALAVNDIVEFQCHAQARGEFICHHCAMDNLLYIARAVCAGHGGSVSSYDLCEYDGPEVCGQCFEYLNEYSDDMEYLETYDYCVSDDFLRSFISRHWNVSYQSLNKRTSDTLERAARIIVASQY